MRVPYYFGQRRTKPTSRWHKKFPVTRIPVFPPLLKSGARVALVSPAGPVTDEKDLERAADNTLSLGWEPVIGKNAGARTGYLAGADSLRLDDINAAIRDPNINGIWCVRGGYGSMRLLDAVDYSELERNPKTVIGFSDITALHSAILRNSGVIAFHGPTARGELSEFSRSSLVRAVAEGKNPCGVAPAAREIFPGSARGRLIGGNLAVLTALIGTRFAPVLKDCILVLEDVNEPLYRIDRMLHQLLLCGALSECVAIAFGDFTGADESGATGGLDDLLSSLAERLGIPCLGGIPLGHIPDQWTIPLGAEATLDTAARELNVLITKENR